MVELLVVISIIGLLAAMLLPSLTAAKQKALRTQCLSSVCQVGLAVHMYAGDNDDKMVPVFTMCGNKTYQDPGSACYNLWAGYLGNNFQVRLEECPAAALRLQAFGIVTNIPSYAGNRAIPWSPQDTSANEYLVKLSSSQVPTDTGMMTCAGEIQNNTGFLQFMDGWNMGYSPLFAHGGSVLTTNASGNYYYANGSGSFAFFDGHAEARKPDMTSMMEGYVPIIRPANSGVGSSVWARFWAGGNSGH